MALILDCRGRSSVVEHEPSKLGAAGSIPAARFRRISSDPSGMLSDVKTAERIEARRLRREEGRAVKEIARLLAVAPSTVSVWVRDIELTDQQHAALLMRNPAYNGQRNGWAANAERGRLRRRRFQLDGRRRVRRHEPLYVAGCMLYWAEGAKTRNRIDFVNADPEAIRLFARFLRECFGVTDERMRTRSRAVLARSTRVASNVTAEVDREQLLALFPAKA